MLVEPGLEAFLLIAGLIGLFLVGTFVSAWSLLKVLSRREQKRKARNRPGGTDKPD